MHHHRNGFFAAASALALVVACGSGSGGGSTGNACSDYTSSYVALLAKCGTPVPPSSELTREEARLAQVCNNEFALPGVIATGSDLEACVSAASSQGCRQTQVISACQLPAGSKPDGSACNSDAQCQSYRCQLTGTNLACGTCATTIADGKPCGGTSTASCGRNSACDYAPPKTTGTCTAVTYGSAGAACGTSAKQCAADTYCDPATSKCAATLGAGAQCAGTQECSYPLVCSAHKCENPGAAGAACTSDTDCGSGLGCSSKGKCGTVTWASAGQACGDLARCSVGGCPFFTTGKPGMCPKVIADGQACGTSSSSTCDVGSTCMNGKCAMSYSVVCGAAKK